MLKEWTLGWIIWVGYLGWERLRVKKKTGKSGGDIDLWWTINCMASLKYNIIIIIIVALN